MRFYNVARLFYDPVYMHDTDDEKCVPAKLKTAMGQLTVLPHLIRYYS
jgi:hypothetical protein